MGKQKAKVPVSSRWKVRDVVVQASNESLPPSDIVDVSREGPRKLTTKLVLVDRPCLKEGHLARCFISCLAVPERYQFKQLISRVMIVS